MQVAQANVIGDRLDAAIKEVIRSQIEWSITFKDVETIMEYVDKKHMDRLLLANFAKRIKSPVQR